MDSVELKITTPESEYPYLKRFSSGISVLSLKDKLQLVVGVSKEHMKLELLDKAGKLIGPIENENATLKSSNVLDGMEIRVINMAAGDDNIKETSAVEKYVMSDEKYNERTESLRAWMKRERLTSKTNVIEQSERAAKNMKVGDRCIVQLQNRPNKSGTISFVGKTKFKEGWWVGVTYDEPVGKNDGSVNGVRYFVCSENCGGFVRPQDVQIVREIPNVEMEEI